MTNYIIKDAQLRVCQITVSIIIEICKTIQYSLEAAYNSEHRFGKRLSCSK